MKSGITHVGQTMLARYLKGEQMTFTSIKIGTGEVAEGADILTLTGLSHEVLSVNNLLIYRPSEKHPNLAENEIILEASYNNREFLEQKKVIEYGIYAKIGEEPEKLYAYINKPESPDYIPSYSSDTYVTRIRTFALYVGNSQNVQALIDLSAVYPTLQQFNDGLATKEPVINKATGFLSWMNNAWVWINKIRNSDLATMENNTLKGNIGNGVADITFEDVKSAFGITERNRIFDNSFDIQLDGANPKGMVYVEDNNCIYVAIQTSKKVNVYDFTTRKKLKEITIPGEPQGICYNKDKKQLYVASNTTNEISVIDILTNTIVKSITNADISAPYYLAYNSTRKEVYVAQLSTKLVVIDTLTDVFKSSIVLGDSTAQYLKVDEANGILYVSSTTPNNKLRKINLANMSVTSTLTVSYARFIEITDTKIFVSIDDSANSRLIVIDKATFTLSNTLDLSAVVSAMLYVDTKLIIASSKGLIQFNPVTLIEEKIIRKDCAWSFDIFKKNEVYYLSEISNNRIKVIDEKVEQKLNAVKGLIDTDQAVLGTQIVGYIQDMTEIVGGKCYIDRITGKLFIPNNLVDNVGKKGSWITANSDFMPYNLKNRRDSVIATYVCNHATIPNCQLNIFEFENRYEFEFIAYNGLGMGVANTDYSIVLPITLDIARPTRLIVTGGNAAVPQSTYLYSNTLNWRNGATAPTPSISGWGIAFKRGATI